MAEGTKSAVAEESAVPDRKHPILCSEPPPPEPNSSPCAIPAVAEGSASSPSPGPAVVSACSEVAPPPLPRESAPPPSEPIPLPRREALLKGDFAAPLPPLPPPPDQPVANAAPKLQHRLSGNAMPSAVVEVLEEEEEPVIVGELSSPLVAGEITLFAEDLRTAKAWVGVSAFLLFILCRRLR